MWIQHQDGTWKKDEDRKNIAKWRYLTSDEAHCIVLIHREEYITPEAWMVEDFDEEDPKFTLDQSQRRRHISSVDSINHADSVMWNHITAPKGSTFTLLKGCKTLLYPILAMSIIVSLLTTTTGESNYKMPWSVQETQRQHNNADFVPNITRTIAKDQPFCVWLGYDFDSHSRPPSQLCDLVQDTAEHYITDGKLVVIDSRW